MGIRKLLRWNILSLTPINCIRTLRAGFWAPMGQLAIKFRLRYARRELSPLRHRRRLFLKEGGATYRADILAKLPTGFLASSLTGQWRLNTVSSSYRWYISVVLLSCGGIASSALRAFHAACGTNWFYCCADTAIISGQLKCDP